MGFKYLLAVIAASAIVTTAVAFPSRIHAAEPEWVRLEETTLEELEPVGKETYGSEIHTDLYLARAFVNTTSGESVIPGKYSEQMKQMYFSFEGVERTTRNFEVLKYPRGTASWINKQCRSNMVDLIVGGSTANGAATLYICRFLVKENVLVTGSFMALDRPCVVPFGGGVQNSTNYEVLALTSYGVLN